VGDSDIAVPAFINILINFVEIVIIIEVDSYVIPVIVEYTAFKIFHF
jgi:hypothetical protein